MPTLEAEADGLEVEWEEDGQQWGQARDAPELCDPGAASIRGGAGRHAPRWPPADNSTSSTPADTDTGGRR